MQKPLTSFHGKMIWMILPGTIALFACAQSSPEQVRLNQIGFYPTAPKIAVIPQTPATEFRVTTADQSETVFTGKLSDIRISRFSKKETRLADFSALTAPGTYVLVVEGSETSFPFEIKNDVHEALAKASIKAFYYQRVSTGLPEKYAGKWNRKAGHPDTNVYVHGSAATASRPEGTVISSPKGWYDAGDYNKYIVNSGITMGTLLSLYEDFPQYVDKINLNIPESENDIPDLLDEILWNLRWMLTMQDLDGGVYHKLTAANFEGMVMPHEATSKRYVVQKGTAATLDFAAVMAQASRVLKKFDHNLPGLSDSCLTAAEKAWNWSQQNPAILYRQSAMNQKFDPDIQTGGYGDNNLQDELIWAACELYVTTKNDAYYRVANVLANEMLLPSWPQVKLLGYYTLSRFKSSLTEAGKNDVEQINKRLVSFADNLIEASSKSAYSTVMGQSERDFVWGSNAVAANQGIALLQAYRITADSKYINHALSNLDYLLGRNATAYSFVTGCGDKPPMHPHHRPSEADDVEEPIPGLLVGGPNPGRQDRCDYPSAIADEAYVDHSCSYASNEIAINWNAPLVYLACAMEALQEKAGYKK